MRVGFVSADLRRHSVSYFFEPLLEHLDRSAFQVLVFPTVAHPDAVTARPPRKGRRLERCLCRGCRGDGGSHQGRAARMCSSTWAG